MKKNKNHEKKSLLRQLISGTVYVALASVVVAVTVNTTAHLLSDRNTNIPDASPDNINVELPSVPDIPPLTLPELSSNTPLNISDDASKQVSDTADGVNSIITETLEHDTPENTQEIINLEIPADADLGIDRFIKPCDGYVSKEHSADIPVYSATLSDYRIHLGVDVTGDIGTPVSAVCGGIVSDIYDDDLLGKTVSIKTRSGYTVKYSNLLPTLNAPVVIGAVVATGDIIGGIGDTALSEVVDSSHLHLEIYDSDDLPVNPEDLICF